MTRHVDRPILWAVTPENKAWAIERMGEIGMTRAELARAAKTSTAYISMLFDEGKALPIRNSRLWPRIVAALGGEPPTLHAPRADSDVAVIDSPPAAAVPPAVGEPTRSIDDDTRAIMENWGRLTTEERAAVAALVRALTTARR